MLSHSNLIRILDESQLEGTTKNRKLAHAPKSVRQDFIQNSAKGSDDARISAAIEIQRRVRGYKVRCGYFGTLEPKVSTTAVYSDSKQTLQRLTEDMNIFDELFIDINALGDEAPTEEELRSLYDEWIKKMIAEGWNPEDLPSFEEFCEAYRQMWNQAKQDQDSQLIKEEKLDDTVKVIKVLTEQDAAVVIQRTWRRHIDIQVYRYYRDLINFKTRGDPSLMLRCINPNEAQLLDAASGIHIRFRLAGERFPPNIYYKIFTHRPIVDMCANSPKDYTSAESKKTTAKDTNTKDRVRLDPPPVKDGWYKRFENNGWRLVSDRLIHHIMSDPVTYQTSTKKYEYHHDKLVRRQDVEKRRKQKKIDWMKKMYKDGMLKAKADDYETVKLIEGAAAGMVATLDAGGPEALQEWEVDELLDWTTSLNFDDYWSAWKDTATSSHSEKKIADRMRIVTNNMDPFEFSLSTGPSRFQSTRQSHNTPVSSNSGTKIHVHVSS